MHATNLSALLLATILHDAGRQPVAAGQTLAHAVDPAKTRPFIEFSDLPGDVRDGRLLTATRLLDVVEIAGPAAPDQQPSQETIDWLAEQIHAAEKAAVDLGLVLVKLNRPWVAFGDLPEQAKEGRRGQARYFLGRFVIRPAAAPERERAPGRPGSWRIHIPAPINNRIMDPAFDAAGGIFIGEVVRAASGLMIQLEVKRKGLLLSTVEEPTPQVIAALDAAALEYRRALKPSDEAPSDLDHAQAAATATPAVRVERIKAEA